MFQDSILSEKMHKFLFIVFGHVFLDIFSAFSKGVRLIFLLHSHHDMYSRKSQYQKVYKHINQKVYKKIVDHTTMQGGGTERSWAVDRLSAFCPFSYGGYLIKSYLWR